MRRKIQTTRRNVLKAAALAPLLGLGSKADAAPKGSVPRGDLPRNVVLFMTDQERATQHFPPGWESQNLPGLTYLKNNGLTFTNAYTNSCMCSPARSTWMTGYFPAQHGVKYTLEEDMPAGEYPQVELPLDLPNIASVMTAAGFNVVYKGKWHCTKPTGKKHWVQQDLEQYGFARWNPQDAGANQDLDQAGGGFADNDGRFMNDDGEWEAGREGALTFLNSQAAAQQPFFLIISLVNPHDVLFYPRTFADAGYDNSWLAGDIGIPATASEDLSTKPTVQKQFRNLSRAFSPIITPQQQRDYLNFYGNLIQSSDNYLVEVLRALATEDLLEDTLIIRTADHGEMGQTHGGQIQKNFNFYQEATRIPLVYSNPRFYDGGLYSDALVSHVDFLPTIASLYSAPESARANWQGVDYSELVLNPSAAPVQDYLLFTYDDFQSGQASGPYPTPPNHIVSIIEQRYKLAEYYDVNGNVPSQWEMYDIVRDPDESKNLAYSGYKRNRAEQREFERLQLRLRLAEQTRLQPLG